MIAVREALQTPDEVFLPMVIVDTIVPYVWMGGLVGLSAMQNVFDRWNRSDSHVLDDISQRISQLALSGGEKSKWFMTILIFLFGLGMSFLTQKAAQFFPVIKDVMATHAWTIILVSALGLLGSLTPLKKLEGFGSTRVGYFLLYFVLTTIGAKASISNIGSSLVLVLAGVVLIFFHGGLFFIWAGLMKARMFLGPVASQANVGGVASAPIVAEIYRPGLSAVGLLMAIFGNIIGTYLGILAGQMCRFIAY